tara:strand:- start:3656 stop:5938 length:2283 start_codon:yes stop_codon:yes gene_type:complete
VDFFTSTAGVFVLGLVCLLALERFSPWRRELTPVRHRWLSNIGLMLIGGIAAGILFSHDLNAIAADLPGGPLRDAGLPLWFESLLVILLLDGWRYWEHRIFHEVPLLWRTHLTHHSDTHIDVTTAERHHPLEVVLVTGTGMLLLFAVGYSAEALGVYFFIASLSALYTHASIRLPPALDRALRSVLVTPAVHAVHHSSEARETNSNYGTLLTVWDRLFGTYVSPDKARLPHFGLEYFHRDEDTALGPVLLQPFEYRQQAGFYPAREAALAAAPAPASTPLPAQWRRAIALLTLCSAACAAILWPVVVSLAQVWGTGDTYQYAWLILPTVLYACLWHHRQRLLALTPQPDYAGLLFVLPGLALWSAAWLVDIQLGQHLALVLLLQGIVLSVLGRQVYAALFPALALLFMMVPCGDLLQGPLRQLTVHWIEWFARAVGADYSIEGYVAWVNGQRYVVVDACSGLTFVLMGGFLGYSFGLLLYTRLWRVLALGALGALLGVFTNALRVWLILGVDLARGSQIDMAGHADLQWLALAVCMGLLFCLALRARPQLEALPAAETGTTRAGAGAPLLASIAIATTVAGLQLATAGPREGDAALEVIAAMYPGSTLAEVAASSDRALRIPYSDHFEAVLVAPDEERGRVQEMRFYPRDMTTWRHAATYNYRDCAGEQCVDFVHRVFNRKGSDQERHAVYAWFVGAQVTSSRLDFRFSNGLNRLRDRPRPAGALGFRVLGEMPRGSELAAAFLEIHRRAHGEQQVAGAL